MFTITEIVGWLGLLLLAVPWVIQTVVVLRTRKATIPMNFNVLYVVGSGLLSAYSFLIGDIIFFIMNVLATCASLVHLLVSLPHR